MSTTTGSILRYAADRRKFINSSTFSTCNTLMKAVASAPFQTSPWRYGGTTTHLMVVDSAHPSRGGRCGSLQGRMEFLSLLVIPIPTITLLRCVSSVSVCRHRSHSKTRTGHRSHCCSGLCILIVSYTRPCTPRSKSCHVHDSTHE